jgi:hypothetical protein
MAAPLLLDESDARWELRSSTIPGAGRGVFARIDLPAGAALEVIGVLVRSESAADSCTRFADCHKFRVGDRLLIPVGFGAMVNHSTSPNLEKVIDGERIWLRTLRPISAGEELFFRYPDSALVRLGIG